MFVLLSKINFYKLTSGIYKGLVILSNKAAMSLKILAIVIAL